MKHFKPETIAIFGAGIAGIATAYYLAKNNSKLKIILIDKQQPLSFTTSKSRENFRHFWPQKCMRNLSDQSIHLMKALRNDFGEDSFSMSFSSYDFINNTFKCICNWSTFWLWALDGIRFFRF